MTLILAVGILKRWPVLICGENDAHEMDTTLPAWPVAGFTVAGAESLDFQERYRFRGFRGFRGGDRGEYARGMRGASCI